MSLSKYVVHFQNLGNFPADFVTITDTLGSFFDLASLRVESASHPFEWSLTGNMLRVEFRNIHLLPANANAAQSQGFVKFKLTPHSGLLPGSLISNRADIVFDYNAPIRTAPADTWISFVPTTDLDILYASPNPAAQWIRFRWKHPALQDGTLRLVDMNGVLHTSLVIEKSSQFADVLVTSMASGVYWAILDIGARHYVKQVVIISTAPNSDTRRE